MSPRSAKDGRWLVMMHQLPPKPDSFRVKIWRALQKSGAIQLKNSVYVLPMCDSSHEAFGAIVAEIAKGKGEAFLCESKFILGIENVEIISMFNADRAARLKVLAAELRPLLKVFPDPSESGLMEVEHAMGRLDRQARELLAMDYFDCGESGAVMSLLESLANHLAENRSATGPAKVTPARISAYQGKTWVTRADIHTDRLASAWLIVRSIDKKAKFKFVATDRYKPRANEIRFDMFDAEFTHVGDRCTFETLIEAFGIERPQLVTIAEIIHDLDLKDTKFNRPEAAGVAIVLSGIVTGESKDEARLAKAFAFFDELGQGLSQIRKSKKESTANVT